MSGESVTLVMSWWFLISLSIQSNLIISKLNWILQAAVTYKNYKMIWGQEFLLDRAQRLQAASVQLYDIDKDPEERDNIAHLNDEVYCPTLLMLDLNNTFSVFISQSCF